MKKKTGTAVAVALLPLAGGCGAPDLHDPETVEKIVAEALNVEDLQERGDLAYASNRSEPYSGWAVEYYTGDPPRVLKQLSHYVDGEPHGQLTHWYENSQMEGQGKTVDGELHGQYTTWYDNGQMESQGDYVDGEQHDQWTQWYENGQMAAQGQFVDGELHGQWTLWHENGQMIDQGYLGGYLGDY